MPARPPNELDDDLIEEMLGRGDPNLPEGPVLLGEYSPEEAEACGAFHDPALDRAAELYGLGGPCHRQNAPQRGGSGPNSASWRFRVEIPTPGPKR